jgi:transcriptional regulator GlxA family with amidase domain
VTTQGPNVKWVKEARWAEDGNIWTSSGISAGIDMMFAFIEKQYGSDAAEDVRRGSEYVRNTNPKDDPFAQYAG